MQDAPPFHRPYVYDLKNIVHRTSLCWNGIIHKEVEKALESLGKFEEARNKEQGENNDT